MLFVAGVVAFFLGLGAWQASAYVLSVEQERVEGELGGYDCGPEFVESNAEETENGSVETGMATVDDACLEERAEERAELTRENWVRAANSLWYAGAILILAGPVFVSMAVLGLRLSLR